MPVKTYAQGCKLDSQLASFVSALQYVAFTGIISVSGAAGVAAVFSCQEWSRGVCESPAGFWGFNNILLSGTNINNSLMQTFKQLVQGVWADFQSRYPAIS